MACTVNDLPMNSDEAPPAAKKRKLIYPTNKPLGLQLDEKESMITKLSAWVSCAQICGYLLSILGWIMCITSTAAEQWRIWYVEDVVGNPSGVVWIGIWRACYMYGTNSENVFLRCEEFTEEFRGLPKEIFLAQELMPLSCIVGAVAICFMTFALWNVFKTVMHETFLLTFFKIGGILNLLSSIMILIPISWNLYSVLANEGIAFPNFFNVPVFPKYQKVGAAIYVGYVASLLCLLSGCLILCNKNTLQRNENFSQVVKLPFTTKVSNELCTTCKSSVVINIQNNVLSETNADLASTSSADINKHSSQSITKQMSANLSTHPIILVTPCK